MANDCSYLPPTPQDAAEGIVTYLLDKWPQSSCCVPVEWLTLALTAFFSGRPCPVGDDY